MGLLRFARNDGGLNEIASAFSKPRNDRGLMGLLRFARNDGGFDEGWGNDAVE